MNKNEDLNKTALKAGFFYVLTQLMVRGITFLTTPVYTRLVSTEQFGQLRVYESWMLILVPLMSLGLYRGVERAKYDFLDHYDGYVSSTHALSYFSITVFLGLFIVFYKDIIAFFELNGFLFTFMFLYIFSYTSTMFYQRREKQKMQYKNVTIITVATMLPATLLSIGCLYWGNATGHKDILVELRVLGYYLPQIIVGFILAIIITKQGKTIFDKDSWKYGLAFSVPLIPELLSIQIMNQSDKIMIQKMVGFESAGIFALGTTVSFIMWIIEESVWNAWLPWLYEKITRGEKKDIERPWLIIVTGFAIITFLIVLIAPEIILVLGGEQYRDAAYLVAPMTLGTLFRFFSYIYSAMQNYYKKTKYVAIGTIGAMIINLILNYVCIRQFGYMAAAYTTAFSYLLLMFFQAFLERLITGEIIVPLWKMLLFSSGLTIACLLTMQLFSVHWIVRWMGAIIVILVFFLINKKMILQCISEKLKRNV